MLIQASARSAAKNNRCDVNHALMSFCLLVDCISNWSDAISNLRASYSDNLHFRKLPVSAAFSDMPLGVSM